MCQRRDRPLSINKALTIYTILYPQGHSGPQVNGHPLMATPFLFDRRDTTPVYRLMYQTFSDSLHDRQPTEVSSEPQHTLAAMAAIREGDGSTPPPSYRTIWASDQRSREDALKWWRVILIQNGKDKGFTQAPIRTGPGSVRTGGIEEYKGHVLEVRIEASPTVTVGTIAQNIFQQCYTLGSVAPTSNTLYYTLGSSSRHSNLNQRRTPEQPFN